MSFLFLIPKYKWVSFSLGTPTWTKMPVFFIKFINGLWPPLPRFYKVMRTSLSVKTLLFFAFFAFFRFFHNIPYFRQNFYKRVWPPPPFINFIKKQAFWSRGASLRGSFVLHLPTFYLVGFRWDDHSRSQYWWDGSQLAPSQAPTNHPSRIFRFNWFSVPKGKSIDHLQDIC